MVPIRTLPETALVSEDNWSFIPEKPLLSAPSAPASERIGRSVT